MIHGFNAAVTWLFELLSRPWMALPPIWGLMFLSLLTGVSMVWIFGRTSDQEAIKRVKRGISGNLIGVKLYGHDLWVTFQLQRRVLRLTLTYMRLSLVPLLILIWPVLAVIIQLNLRFAARPLLPAETTLVKVKVRDAAALEHGVTLTTPSGVTVETPGVRIFDEREISWRVRVNEPGAHTLAVRTGNEEVSKLLIAGQGWRAVSTLRTGRNVIDMLLYPGEAPISAQSSIESIEVRHPDLSINVFGLNIHWLVLFFVLSIAFGFAFKDLLGVQV